MTRKFEGKSRREENTEATRAALLDAAQEAFLTHGFAKSSTEAIARAARVSRGAFYHHFEDKTALFDAVVVALQKQAVEKVSAKALKKKDLWDRLYAGMDAYLDICLQPVFGRIVVQQARAVLGEERFAEIENQHTVALLKANLAALHEAGRLAAEDPALLSQVVDAIICRLATALQAPNTPKNQKQQCRATLKALMEGLKRG